MNLQWLFDRFQAVGDRPAFIWCGQEFSYGWLLARVVHWRNELEERRVAHGTVLSIEADFSPESAAVLLALVNLDAIVVPFAAGVGPDHERELAIAEVECVLTVEAGGGWSDRRRDQRVSHPLLLKLRGLGNPGLILFSSGSTGQSKGIVHDFGRLFEKFHAQRPALRTISFLLFDHIGGINTLLHTLSNGGTLVTVGQRDPDSVCALIERYRIELLPTSPTFLNLVLLSEAHTRHDLSSLKLITYGTEPMPASTLQRLHCLLPMVRLSQTYGLSEVGILRAKSESSESLLVKLGGEGVETKVVDGLLWIRTHSAMLGYLNAPSPFDAEGWFNTGDEVEVCGEYYRILGRRSELINVGGEKVYPAEVESVLLAAPNVADATVRGEPNPITGQMVVAEVALHAAEDPVLLRQRLRAFCRERLQPYKVPAKIAVSTGPNVGARFKKMRGRSAV